MTCYLRIEGDFDPQQLLAALHWEIDEEDFWCKGDLNRKGEKIGSAGMQLFVSDAEFEQLEEQIKDAIDFLTAEEKALSQLHRFPGVQEYWLDFGIAQHCAPAYFRYFPADFIRLAGRLGLGLEVSLYAVSGVGGFD